MEMKLKNMFPAIILISLIAFYISSCKEIKEEDISDLEVVLITPPDSTYTTVLTQVFWWNEIEGASKYHIQIASPSFSAPEYLILDSNLTINIYEYTLNPGDYEWRVKAFNGAYETEYTTYSLSIDSTPDLSNQQVILISPSDNYITNDMNFTFQWYELYNADDYRFELRSPDWNGNLVIPVQITEYDTINLTLEEGFYVWGIQAQNITSNSPFSSRNLVVDTTAPATPNLSSPANSVVINDSTLTNSEIVFSWTRGYNAGSTIKDSLYISSDSLFQTGNTGLIYTPDSSYSFTMTSSGNYFWRVKSIDAASNESNYSVTRKLTYEE